MPGSTRINPPSPRTAMALLQTHALCRTQTPSATCFSLDSLCQVSRPRALVTLAARWNSSVSARGLVASQDGTCTAPGAGSRRGRSPGPVSNKVLAVMS